MAVSIDSPAKSEFWSAIRFLQAEGNSASEIHRRMIRVYGDNFMSDGVVREWCRKYKDSRTDVHDERSPWWRTKTGKHLSAVETEEL